MSETVSSSMLQKFKDFVMGRKNDEITPAEALKIQKASYTLNHAEQKKKFSPTYLSIIDSLDSKEKQLFEASVTYLIRIAKYKQKYTSEIMEILKEKSNDSKVNPEFREYIKQKMRNIL